MSGSEAHHLRSVLRIRPGGKVRAFDGRGYEALGKVADVAADRIALVLEPPTAGATEAPVRLTLAVALLKGDKLSEVVRACTEIGMFAFRPFMSSRCEPRTLAAGRLERLRRVAREAAKQSGRSVIPHVFEPVELGALPLTPPVLVAHPDAAATLGGVGCPQASGELTLLTGPEGGLTDAEVQALVARGATLLRLGRRILRAETAPLALASALLVPEAL